MNRRNSEKVFLVFNPMDARGDVGCEEGTMRLYHRILAYLSMTDERISVYKFFDFKDNFVVKLFSPEDVKNYHLGEELVKKELLGIINSSRPFFYVGGNHLSILPILKCYSESDSRTLFLTFDSHLDAAPSSLLGKKWDADRELSFATYLSPFLDGNSHLSFVHVGSKHPLKDALLSKLNIRVLTVQDLFLNNEGQIETCLDKIISHRNVDRLHIDVDIDVLDHSVMRATFDPGSFGLTLDQLLRLLRCAVNKLPLVGVDIVGYNPRIESSKDYEEVCLRLFENIIYIITHSVANRRFWFRGED